MYWTVHGEPRVGWAGFGPRRHLCSVRRRHGGVVKRHGQLAREGRKMEKGVRGRRGGVVVAKIEVMRDHNLASHL